LRRFLAPQLADLTIAQGDESILESRRREIVVVFCDVRCGFRRCRPGIPIDVGHLFRSKSAGRSD
jgi:hypothetical protein